MRSRFEGGDPENPRDLRGAPLVLTGTIEDVDGWLILDTPAGRWALLRTAGLRPGEQVTVRGWPQGVPAACPSPAALRVVLVTPVSSAGDG